MILSSDRDAHYTLQSVRVVLFFRTRPSIPCLCIRKQRGDRLLRHTEGNDDVHHDVDDGEERPIRGSDRALVSTTSPSSSSSSSSSSCESSLAGIISPSASPSSSSSEAESYSCSKKALDDDKINKWITSKVFFMPAAATVRTL